MRLGLPELLIILTILLLLFGAKRLPGLAKSLGKRIGKAVGKAGEASGVLVTFLTEIFRGARMIRIYQKEKTIN